MLGTVIASRISRMSSAASQTVIQGETTQAGTAQAGTAQAGIGASDAARIMGCFESLGDTCEFGFAQRHFGIEPIGLLRWAGAPLPGLLDALGARFAGLYRRDDLVVIDGGSVLDRKYDLRFHAGPYTDDGLNGQRPVSWTEAALAAHAREQRHIGFLLRTTLDTLASRSRIFVYKTNAGLELFDVLQLKAALDLYGPQRLLCVVPEARKTPAGAARLIAAGVKVAGITRFAPYTCQDDVDAACWLALCASALEGDWGDAAAIPPEPGAGGETAARPLAFEPTETGAMVYEPTLARALATAIYQVLLLRPPDDGGLRVLAGSLSAGQRSVEEAMISALESPEFTALAPRFLARYTKR